MPQLRGNEPLFKASHFTTINYMHVRTSGDPVEITGERDSLAIGCDLSEVHSCNNTHSGRSHEQCTT
jgi:hypothetical protein